MVNHGTIVLDSSRGDRWSHVTTSTNTLTNAADGTIQVKPGGGGSRYYSGNLTNQGSITVEARIGLHDDANGTFKQLGGSIDAQGWLSVTGGRFEFTGGTIDGTVNTANADNYFTEDAAGRVYVYGTTGKLSGTISHETTVYLTTNYDYHTKLTLTSM